MSVGGYAMTGGVRRFEDLIAWQKARALTKDIYLLTATERFARDFGLRNQIQRASISIMSNIAEGFERGGNAEFHQYLVVAKASCAEVRSDLYVALDTNYITKDQFQNALAQAEEVGRIIGGLRASLRKVRSTDKGTQNSALRTQN
jgi:four helix bundle protein